MFIKMLVFTRSQHFFLVLARCNVHLNWLSTEGIKMSHLVEDKLSYDLRWVDSLRTKDWKGPVRLASTEPCVACFTVCSLTKFCCNEAQVSNVSRVRKSRTQTTQIFRSKCFATQPATAIQRVCYNYACADGGGGIAITIQTVVNTMQYNRPRHLILQYNRGKGNISVKDTH